MMKNEPKKTKELSDRELSSVIGGESVKFEENTAEDNGGAIAPAAEKEIEKMREKMKGKMQKDGAYLPVIRIKTDELE